MTRSRGEEYFRRDDPPNGIGVSRSLADAIGKSEGGLWFASDYWTDPETIRRRALEVRPSGLRLQVRDLSFVADLPWLRYLVLESDGGGPILDPIASLPNLEALLLGGLRVLRGDLDPLALPRLRWLSAGLGGKGGATMRERLRRGHSGLDWLALNELPFRRIDEAMLGLPRLRYLSLGFADFLREPGDLSSLAGTLRGLHIGGIKTLAGLEVLRELDALTVAPIPDDSLQTVAALPRLRYANLLRRDLSIEPLRGHQGIRMIWLSSMPAATVSVLRTMPNLIAVGGAEPGAAMPWANLREHAEAREEWFGAMRG